MKITDGERLIALMLADLMIHMKVEGELDPKLLKSLLINKDDWAIAHEYTSLAEGEGPSDEVVSETINILWMWGIIEHSVDQLSGNDAAEAKGWLYSKFRGFDGNNDPHFGVAATLINKLGRFEEFAGRDLNSHSQASLPHYRDMFAKFQGYVDRGQASPLSMEGLRDLCS